jgi:hypothetical protein
MTTKPAAVKENVSQVAELALESEPVRAPAVIPHPLEAVQPSDQPMRGSAFPRGGEILEQIAWLIQNGIAADQVDRYLEMQREQEKENARRAFHAAMAAFKREEIPAILKSKRVGYNTRDGDVVSYAHETLDQVVGAVIGPMARHGLTHKWILAQEKAGPKAVDGMITVRCVVTHERGHSEFVELFALPDDSGKKNRIQQVKSTVSYLERITLLAIAGLAAKGMDDDGRQGSEGDPTEPTPAAQDPPAGPRSRGGDGKATAKQIILIRKRLETAKRPEADLLAQFQIAELESLPFDRVNDVLAWIS